MRLSRYPIRVLLFIALLGSIRSGGQDAPQQSGQSLPDAIRLEQVPRLPGMSNVLPGFNAGITFSAVHDSSIGWYNLMTPAFSYTFSPRYSMDASFSLYPYRLTQNQSQFPAPGQRLVSTHGDVGDTLVGLHGYFTPKSIQTTLTASSALPSGNENDGLGTGHVTFDFDDHMERYVQRTGFILDLGGGDTSGLFDRLVSSNYSSLGPIAHFQTGLVYWFRSGSYIQSIVYEQLPLGDQKVYSTISALGKPSQTVVSGRGVSEDNGFTTLVGVPLSPNVMLSGYYNRSLRLHLDTVSFGVTYVLRGHYREKHLSMIDRAILQAEGATR